MSWQDTPCILHDYPLNDNGYGVRYEKEKTILLHREEWEKVHGPIPKGKILHHLCETRRCKNVNHLELTTRADHADGAVAKQRNKTHCRHGHEFTLENTITARGRRECRTCHRMNGRLWWKRKQKKLNQENSTK